MTDPKGPGRPRVGPGDVTKIVTMRLPSSLVAKLDEVAARCGVGRSEMIRTLIRKELDEWS